VVAYCVQSIVMYVSYSSVSSCTAHNIYITMDLAHYAATTLHVHNDVILPNILTVVIAARPNYELPDDGHRPKHIGEF